MIFAYAYARISSCHKTHEKPSCVYRKYPPYPPYPLLLAFLSNEYSDLKEKGIREDSLMNLIYPPVPP